MKIGIYSPYLDTYGGGERYILTVAECLAKDHQVDLFFDSHLMTLHPPKLLTKLSERLKLDLSNVNYVKAPFGDGEFAALRIIKRLFFLARYDLLIYLTDGSIFYSTAKKNVIHFQVPFGNFSANSAWGRFKLNSWKKAIYNSAFTKDIVEKSWPIKGEIVYPPVDTQSFKPLPKKKNILSVGRFFNFLHSKKQEVLVNSFINMVKGGLKDWKLQLAGGTNETGRMYLDKIIRLGKGYPIEYFPDTSFENLKKLYGEASIYWHAAGYGEKDPKKLEHFGITTVEAMSAGVVPIVIDSGGQKEIVEHQKSGYLWSSTTQLEEFTNQLIKDGILLKKMSENARFRAQIFSKDKFCRQVLDLLN